ncbi:hypothetical protein LVJ83_08275 [Uruburuella testudinis]|uniref:Triacylglycerol lipase n=1 Tax=Uruburuella testudinis TaxID=1282863 RepID=A0ABY4DPS9_9NEIS|nr:hypothetical protein [Uruburuella testudinis]UOO80978.1 hypothetical protein LVJ83_08275 [Uruburuella testudinis]
MAVFDYKQYSSAEMLALLQTSHALATYSSLSKPMGLPVGEIVGWLEDKGIIDNFSHNKLPAGWRELAPADLGLPQSALDAHGHYIIKSPISGTLLTGPQAKIVAQFDEGGAVQKIGVSFTATNSPVDILDYLQLNEGTIAPNMEPLLQAVKAYAQAQGLSGEDVVVTGYSLGGGYTNIMARFRETLADGFFSDADYIGHAAPVIFDDPSIFNYGYENDVVFRAAGDHATLAEALAAAKPGLVHPDTPYDSSVDNIVLYGDAYASPLWPAPLFSLLNLPFAWYAHVDGMMTDAITRIGESSFYEHTTQDSTIIVSNLSDLARPISWVEDKNTITSDHYGQPAFLIGSQHADKLKGGSAADYIDAGAGNDTIKSGGGNDRIDGGSGSDTLWLDGKTADWQVFHLNDGTVFFEQAGNAELVQAHNIEQVTFNGDLLSHTRPYQVQENELADVRFKLFKSFNQSVEYQTHEEGGSGSDTLKGKNLFGGNGDDILYGNESGGLLHGGEGNDMLVAGENGIRLYGAEGNDILYARGNDISLSGGIGDDTFVFDASGSYQISDFNSSHNEGDRLMFAAALFDNGSLADFSVQRGEDVQIAYQQFSLTVQNSSLDDVMAAGQIIA